MDTWGINGYGIRTSSMIPNKEVSYDGIMRLLERCPEYVQDNFITKLETELVLRNQDGKLTYRDIIFDVTDNFEDERTGFRGFAFLIAEAMREQEGIYFDACEDECGETYVILYAGMPWQLSKKEKKLTEPRLFEIYSTYLTMLDYTGNEFPGMISTTNFC